jgi:hypothetical protein
LGAAEYGGCFFYLFRELNQSGSSLSRQCRESILTALFTMDLADMGEQGFLRRESFAADSTGILLGHASTCGFAAYESFV